MKSLNLDLPQPSPPRQLTAHVLLKVHFQEAKSSPHTTYNFKEKGGNLRTKTENYLGGVGAGPGFKIDFQ